MDIKIKEQNVLKHFVIKELPATEAMLLINKLGSLLSQTDAITPEVFMQFIYIKANSGIEIPGINQDALKSMYEQDVMKLFGMVIQSALLGATDIKQKDIMSHILKCVTFMNGIIPIQLNNIEGSEYHIDNYVKKAATLYRLFLEVVKLHCADFFSMTAE